MALQVEIDVGVATVTINHPPTNLVDGQFFVALLDTVGRLEADESVQVVVFRSADPDFFLMHGDVHMLRDLAPPYVPAVEPNIAAATFTRLRTGRLVTIGLLDGIAREAEAVNCCADWICASDPSAHSSVSPKSRSA